MAPTPSSPAAPARERHRRLARRTAARDGFPVVRRSVRPLQMPPSPSWSTIARWHASGPSPTPSASVLGRPKPEGIPTVGDQSKHHPADNMPATGDGDDLDVERAPMALWRAEGGSDSAAMKIYTLLTTPDNGCGDDAHARAHDAHQAEAGGNHHGLWATYRGASAVSDSHGGAFGLRAGRWPANRGLPREVLPTATALADMFEGHLPPTPGSINDDVATAGTTLRNICLHQDSQGTEPSLASYDVDSMLAFPPSLATFQRGLRYTAVRQVAFNIDSNVHVTRQVEYYGADNCLTTGDLQLRNIPHLYLGSVEGLYRSVVHVFFPRLYVEGRPTSYLTAADVAEFFDEIFWPACRLYLDVAIQQHFPPTQEMAEINAHAVQVEGRVRDASHAQRPSTYYLVQHAYLGPIWESVLRRVANRRRDQAGDFEGLFLVVNTKGFKLDFKSVGSLHGAMTRFRDHLSLAYDLDAGGDIFVDVGQEICPTCEPALSERGDESVARVYLWRRCCLDRVYRRVQRDLFGGKSGRVQRYLVGFLWDAINLTVEPPKRSWIAQAGLVYSHWYASEKEIVDSQKHYPFQDRTLAELAVDPGVWKARASHSRTAHARSRDALSTGYTHAKLRVREGYTASRNRSYGVRSEHRLSWSLFEGVREVAAERERPIVDGKVLQRRRPSSIWSLRTANFVDFMAGNYEKLTSTLELISASSPRTGVPAERTKLMIALFRCLRAFGNCNPERESLLWHDVRKDDRGTRRGFGLEKTVERHGFAWFRPIVDWQDLRFCADVTAFVDVGASRLLQGAPREGGTVISDSAALLDHCFRRLERRPLSRQAEDKLLHVMAHICLRQFRWDVVTNLARQGAQDVVEEVGEVGEVPFCLEGIQEHFPDTWNLVSGNKTHAKSPAEMYEWLWGTGDDDQYPRTHWDERPFRVMAARVKEACRPYGDLVPRWDGCLSEQLFRYHWLLPYPDKNGTLLSTAKGTRLRQWWAVGRGRNGWTWARRNAMTGRPERYPEVLTFTAERFVANLEQI